MTRSEVLKWFACLVAAFFIVGGVGNLFASPPTLTEYRLWGYPDWFHFVTGGLEVLAAVLIIRRRTRLLGAALASAVMVAALGTVVDHGQYAHAIAPLIVLACSCITGWSATRDRT